MRGDEHPATSNSLNNLAGILMEQKVGTSGEVGIAAQGLG